MRRPPPLRVLLLATFFGLALLGAPASAPSPAAGVGPLPECHLDDVLTEPRDYDDWAITQVDWILTLGPDYRPPDLVSVGRADIAGGGMVREVVIKDLKAMAAAARKHGTPIKVLSPFRGYKQQINLFNSYAGANHQNFEDAVTFSARPGHSEHQTGLTIDFGSVGDTALTRNWDEVPAGDWMEKNAWKYGWLMSYPKGEQDVVCYSFEPWHYRYVGRDLAEKIHDSGLTIREYLWANFTQVDAACVALAPDEDDLETPGEPRSCALAEPSPTPPTATQAPLTDEPATAAAGPTATAASPGVVATPRSTPAPSPAGALGSATPVGLAILFAVLAVGAFALWRRSRRPRRVAYRR